MQPSTPTKPVMDIAKPRPVTPAVAPVSTTKPALPLAPIAPLGIPTSTSAGSLPVKEAPRNVVEDQPMDKSDPVPQTDPAKPALKPVPKSAVSSTRSLVGIIVATVLIMAGLAALTVTTYLKS